VYGPAAKGDGSAMESKDDGAWSVKKELLAA
jgi:hypothetical protein